MLTLAEPPEVEGARPIEERYEEILVKLKEIQVKVLLFRQWLESELRKIKK